MMPTIALPSMYTTGCSPFVGFMRLVITQMTTAKAIAGQEKRSSRSPVLLKRSMFSSAISTTEIPATAMSAVDAGRSP